MRLVIVAATLIAQAALAQTAPRAIRVTEALRIDGAKEDLSGISTHIWIGRDGRAAVFDASTARFVFFDAKGKRLGTFGARGQGPGEFAATAPNIFVMRSGVLGDTMWVYNATQRRFSVINRDRQLVRTLQLQPPDPATMVSFDVVALLPGDRFLGKAVFGERRPITLSDGRAGFSLTLGDSAFVVLSRDGLLERRVVNAPPDSTFARINQPGPYVPSIPVPFRWPTPVATTQSGDRIAVVTTSVTSAMAGSFRLTVVRTTGDTVYSRMYPFTPTAVSKAMADSAYTRTNETYGRGANPARLEVLGLVRERIPSVAAPFGAIQIGPDGTVWLQRKPMLSPSSAPSAPNEFLVFSPTGDLLGVATMPRGGLFFRYGTRTEAWATETDADGFVSLVRFRVDTQ